MSQQIINNSYVPASFEKVTKQSVVAQSKPQSVGSSNNSLMSFQNIQKNSQGGITQAFAQAMQKSNEISNKDSGQTKTEDSKALSDERCKELFGSTDLLDAIADIDAYRFHYKEGADKIDPNATPDKEHTGVMAQDLAANDVTKSAVEQDPLSGFLEVNTKELTMTTFAIVTEMAKRIKALEEKVNGNNI